MRDGFARLIVEPDGKVYRQLDMFAERRVATMPAAGTDTPSVTRREPAGRPAPNSARSSDGVGGGAK